LFSYPSHQGRDRLYKRLQTRDSSSEYETVDITLPLVSLSHEQICHMSADAVLITHCISTKDFVLNEEGKLKGLNTVRVEWTKDSSGRWKMEEVPGSEHFFPAQLVFLALGFLGPETQVTKALGVKQDGRSNVETPKKGYATSVKGIFAAGDCRRGQSLIVWGINEGRGAAAEIDDWLMTGTRLPRAGGIKTRAFVPPPSKISRHVAVEA